MLIHSRPTIDASTDLLGLTVFDDQVPLATAPGSSLGLLDAALGGLLSRSIGDERFRAKVAQSLSFQTAGKTPARRIALIGLGARADFSPATVQNAAAQLARHALAVGARDIVFTAAEGAPGESPQALDVRAAAVRAWLPAAALGLSLGAYRFDKYLTADPARGPGIADAWLSPPGLSALPESEQKALLERAQRTADAVTFARDLVNEPAGELTPTRIADLCTARATAAGATATVLSAAECRERGMGLFLAVAQGSEQEPRFVHLSWTPRATDVQRVPNRRIVLVGKGVTFDSGGLSLKTTEGMLDMKTDMAGAAAVLAALPVVAQENLPIEVHALAACTENMISARAYKLGDVLRSMAGKTVEINNTDAEGRLTLADALTYGLALRPDVILDFATLTGACIVALGPPCRRCDVQQRGRPARLARSRPGRRRGHVATPAATRLGEQLKSEVADLRNTGERWGGALTAGLFLKEFVGSTPWIHVDLAGPSTASKEWGIAAKGGTGFGVATILEYLRTVAAESSR